MREIGGENGLENVFFALAALHQKQHKILHFPQFAGQNRGIPFHLLDEG